MYPPQVDFIDDVLTGERIEALSFQPVKGDLIGGGVNLAIDLVAPGQSLSVEVCSNGRTRTPMSRTCLCWIIRNRSGQKK